MFMISYAVIWLHTYVHKVSLYLPNSGWMTKEKKQHAQSISTGPDWPQSMSMASTYWPLIAVTLALHTDLYVLTQALHTDLFLLWHKCCILTSFCCDTSTAYWPLFAVIQALHTDLFLLWHKRKGTDLFLLWHKRQGTDLFLLWHKRCILTSFPWSAVSSSHP